MDVFFKNGPGYVGHELMVPNDFDYRALEMTNGAWALVNNGQHINLVFQYLPSPSSRDA